MKQSLELRSGQSLKLTPQLQQSIKLLQLSLPDLFQEIQAAVDENPLLERASEETPPNTGVDPADKPDAEDGESTDTELNLDEMSADFESANDGADWQESFESPISISSESSDAVEADFDARNSAPESLTDHLLWQARMTRLSTRDTVIVEAVIQSVDGAGYLRVTSAEIKALLFQLDEESEELTLDEIEFAIKMVQSFSPAGVAARDLGERLRILIEGIGETDINQSAEARDNAQKIVTEYLESLGARDFPAIRHGLGLSQTELDDALAVIGQVDPRIDYSPGDTDVHYVSPDVLVNKIQGVWRVELNPAVSRHLYVNPDYERLSKQLGNTEEGKYLGEKLQSARWFIKGLHGRYDTLLRVARAIVARQKEFLEHGEMGMKPMILNDVAQELGMHESTISRATSNKYMLTPAGVFELKYFFTSSVANVDGDAVSSTAVRSLIKKLIENEPVNKPISDNSIASMLNQKGYGVARRTVAKYRESMNIPSSSKRKSLLT